MKKILLILAFFTFASANEESVKVVYDLTTPEVEVFQKKYWVA